MLLLNSEPSLKCLEHPFDCEPFHLTHSSFYYTKVYGLFIAYSNSTVNDHRPLIHSSKVSCHRPFPSLSRSLSRLSLSSYFGNETSFINSKAHNATSHHKWKSFSLSDTLPFYSLLTFSKRYHLQISSGSVAYRWTCLFWFR